MLLRFLALPAASAVLLFPAEALAATYYVSPGGSGSGGGSCASGGSLGDVLGSVRSGDEVVLCDGTYDSPIRVVSGITIRAAEGAVPVLRGPAGNQNDGIFSGGQVSEVVIDGLWIENWFYGGIGLDAAYCNEGSGRVSAITIRNCVVDSNQKNGISAYFGSGYTIEHNIASRNGYGQDSWSSNINVYGVSGRNNVIRGNVAFHGIDTSSNRSDGNGFILDLTLGQGSARFEHNIAFLNGGACIAVTDSGGAELVNNTCFHNAQAAADYMDEFNIGDTCRTTESFCGNPQGQSYTFSGIRFDNNLAIARPGKDGLNTYDSCGGPTELSGQSNLLESGSGDVFVDSGAADFRPQGSSTGDRGAELDFDPRCIKRESGRYTWWTHAPDLEYIRSIGGVARCFDGGGAAPGTGGGGAPASGDAGNDTGACPDGEVRCGGTCVDTSTSGLHCGSCGQSCDPNTPCTNGTCGLPPVNPAIFGGKDGEGACGCRVPGQRSPAAAGLFLLAMILGHRARRASRGASR